MSTVTLSKPHCAITSAEKPDGIASQAFTTALPEAQTSFTLLAINVASPVFIVLPSLPGLTRQSITFERLFAKMDGYAGQARV